jgi:transcriptional regulator with XRE-family HTH domain
VTAETFGEMLKRLRVAAGLSQNRLAREVGVDAAYVNQLERAGQVSRTGRVMRSPSPRRTIVCAVAQVLDLGEARTDRLLYAAGLAPATDWQEVAEAAEAKLNAIRDALADDDDLLTFRRRTG